MYKDPIFDHVPRHNILVNKVGCTVVFVQAITIENVCSHICIQYNYNKNSPLPPGYFYRVNAYSIKGTVSDRYPDQKTTPTSYLDWGFDIPVLETPRCCHKRTKSRIISSSLALAPHIINPNTNNSAPLIGLHTILCLTEFVWQ